MGLIRKIRKKFGWYNLREEVARWVEANMGAEYVEEALQYYDDINSGRPIGGIVDTIIFLDLVETVKKEL